MSNFPAIPEAGLLVLGLDPGTSRIGLALIRLLPDGACHLLLTDGVNALLPALTAKKKQPTTAEPESVRERLSVLRMRLAEVLRRWPKAHAYGVEQPLYCMGPLTSFYLGAAWDCAVQQLCAILPGAASYVELTPPHIDSELGVPRFSQKKHPGKSQKMLRREVGAGVLNQDWSYVTDTSPQADACAAAAVARVVAHAIHQRGFRYAKQRSGHRSRNARPARGAHLATP